jgi:hypothetical protein
VTYELKHSPLRLPHDRLRVTGKKAHRTHDGEAFTATLRLDNTIIGAIENEGSGGETRFIPRPPSSAYRERMRLWDEIVAASEFTRDSVTGLGHEHPPQVPADYVANALVTEFDIGKWLAKVIAAGQGCVRSFSPSLGMSSTYISYRATAGYKVAHDAVLVEQVKTEPLMEGDIWQVWTGESWKDLTAEPPAAEPRP